MYRTTRRARPFLGLVAVLVLALTATACGGDEAPAGDDGTAAPTPGEDLGAKPEVAKPEGDPPGELVIEDLVVGDGAEATPGSMLTMHYVGISWSTGEQFDASWDNGAPFGPFELGAGRVIPGWDEGVAGMKVGGRRRLVIPPEMAYGERGVPPAIGPSETLVFVVDLLEVA